MNTKELANQMGEFIKINRRMAQISQKKLALLIDLSPTYIGRLEHGEVFPTIDTLFRICEVLNICIYDLFIFFDSDSFIDIRTKHTIKDVLDKVPQDKKLIILKIIDDIVEYFK